MTGMITALTRPLSRRALPQPNLVYYLWRFVANGPRTFRALHHGRFVPRRTGHRP